MGKIRFNYPHTTGREHEYIQQAIETGHLSGDGPFTHRCQQWLAAGSQAHKVLLTHSCTAALEMAAILADIQPGDEIIMPSYTFVSTANAFVLRGAVPVFVDIREDTLNLDETKIEAAITDRTKVIVPVHYAGVGCDMKVIMAIAERHDLLVIEDAAQGVMSSYHGQALGSIGHFGAYSFHETKNVISGEGGALLINDKRFVERSEIVWEKGTNRSQFFRGEVDKYTWVDVGSSFLPGELVAAFLWAQFEQAEPITERRLAIYDAYHQAFAGLEAAGRLRRPRLPQGCRHNAHMYYLLLPTAADRERLLKGLHERDIHAVFHYVPLHSAPAGQRFGRVAGSLQVTDDLSARLVRLPLWVDMSKAQVGRVIETVQGLLEKG